MPPIRKFQKEEIIDTAFEIVKEEGLDNLNARRIAKELGCSVQPIFHNFENMEDLKQAVKEKSYKIFEDYMFNRKDTESEYLQTGLGYIKFAREYPEFFKIFFMQKTDLNAEKFIVGYEAGDKVIKAGTKLTGLSYEQQKKFHVKVLIFTHGIACMAATRTIEFSDKEIEELLKETVKDMFIGFSKKGE